MGQTWNHNVFSRAFSSLILYMLIIIGKEWQTCMYFHTFRCTHRIREIGYSWYSIVLQGLENVVPILLFFRYNFLKRRAQRWRCSFNYVNFPIFLIFCALTLCSYTFHATKNLDDIPFQLFWCKYCANSLTFQWIFFRRWLVWKM